MSLEETTLYSLKNHRDRLPPNDCQLRDGAETQSPTSVLPSYHQSVIKIHDHETDNTVTAKDDRNDTHSRPRDSFPPGLEGLVLSS